MRPAGIEGISLGYRRLLLKAIRLDTIGGTTDTHDPGGQMTLEYEEKKEGVSRPSSLAVRSSTTQALVLALTEAVLEDTSIASPVTRAALLALYGACKGSIK